MSTSGGAFIRRETGRRLRQGREYREVETCVDGEHEKAKFFQDDNLDVKRILYTNLRTCACGINTAAMVTMAGL